MLSDDDLKKAYWKARSEIGGDAAGLRAVAEAAVKDAMKDLSALGFESTVRVEGKEPFGFLICDSRMQSEDFTRERPEHCGQHETIVALYLGEPDAVKDAVGGDEPVAWEFQHEDTGLTMYECPQQVEWGFEKNNPRWKKIGPVYRRPQASQLNLDYLREMGRLEARIRELEQASAAVPEDAIDAVSKAMTKAWQLGQDYWRQADGDTQAEWDESGHTEVRFQTLLDETTSMLAASQPEVKS